MRALGWRTGESLVHSLRTDIQRFSFFQAVRLLKQWVGDQGQTEEALPLRFGSTRQSWFPGADIEGLENTNHALLLRIAALGVAGPHGPLPTPYFQWIQDNLRQGDTAMADFMDIFNHRLIDLLYRVRQQNSIGLHTGNPFHTSLANYLGSIAGIATPGLNPLLPLPKRSLLALSGLLANRRMSVPMIENALLLYFKVNIKIKAFQGAWKAIQERLWTRIGSAGKNHCLGKNAMLGRRVWIQKSALEIRIGPLSQKEYWGFLPTSPFRKSDKVEKLRQLLDFLTQKHFDYQIVLLIRNEDIPKSQLETGIHNHLGWGARLGKMALETKESRLGCLELGWSSWLKTQSHSSSKEVAVSKIQYHILQT